MKKMHDIIVHTNKLNGTVSLPPSKSVAHRAIICAALSKGISTVKPIDLSNDITATIECMKKLGAEITLVGDTLTVDGSRTFSAENTVK